MPEPYWQPDEPGRVLTTCLRLIEMMDDLPLADCLAHTRVRVIPIFLMSVVPPTTPIARMAPGAGAVTTGPDDLTVATGDTGGGGGGGGLPPPTKKVPYPPMAVPKTADATTDPDGYAYFTVPLAETIAQVMALKYDGQSPVGVCFDQSFSANAFGVQMQWPGQIAVEILRMEGKDPVLIVDIAKTIVGDTSDKHATLWFQLHGDPLPGHRFVCEMVDVAPPGGPLIGGVRVDPGSVGGLAVGPSPPSSRPEVGVDTGGGVFSSGTAAAPSDHVDPGGLSVGEDLDLDLSDFRRRITPRADRAMTGVTTFTGLRPGALYGYLFKVRAPDGREHVLTQGRFRTFVTNPQRMNIAFGSCHSVSDTHALNRWQVLARRTDQDVLFLIGDQIYADGIDKMFPDTNGIADEEERWRAQYIRRYNQQFAFQPMRDTLRSRPTYMVLDDHEMMDDWGTDDVDAPRLRAGMHAYRTFQQSHGPGGFDAPLVDYHFRRGPAAFYFTDSRTSRKFGAEYPVLGEAQVARLKAWARSEEVQAADLVFVVVPVPPGILPIEALEEWARTFADSIGVAVGVAAGAGAGALAGAILGGIGGFLVGGPAGAAAGAALGSEIGAGVGAIAGGVGAALAYEYLEDNIKDPDLRDAWTYDKNLPDLIRLLDVLFDVGNDVQPNGAAGPKPKGVFVLSGDYHYGTMHRLRSKRPSRRHGVNPTMMQVTSSPISKNAENGYGMNFIIDKFADGTFRLDPGRTYESTYIDRTMERNFGRVTYEHVGPGRRYHVQLWIEGETKNIVRLYELDLDKRPVVLRDMVGDVLAARGRITLLRVHDPNTGYGPSGDRIDGEVVIQLDSAPGRAFGFKLRNDSSLPARRGMLELLSDAFNTNAQVSIDYKMTGPLNGVIIRANLIPGITDMALETKTGKIVLLRVNEVNDVFGPPGDNMRVEVVVRLDSMADGAASGFELRPGSAQPAREGMLRLLRDAFAHGWRVHFDHDLPAGKTKGRIFRVWLTKDAQPQRPIRDLAMGP